MQNALDETVTTVYDALDQVVASVDALGHRATVVYDPASRKVEQIDPLGNVSTNVYDAAERRVALVEPTGSRTTSVFDDGDRMLARVDGTSHTSSFLYDAEDRTVAEIDALGRRVTFGYDAVGNQTLKVNARGQSVTSAYDAVGRLVSEEYFSGRRNTYTYDAVGRRATAKDADGGAFTYTHDPLGQLTQLVNPKNQQTTISYDDVGRVARRVAGNGAESLYSYDAGGNLTRLDNLRSDGSAVNVFTYTYDAAGNRRTAEELSGDCTTWTYDATQQLIREQRSGASGYDTTYTYDAVGNRLVQEDAGALTTYVYDVTNQLLSEEGPSGVTSYTYDADGNRTEKDAPAAVTYYTWDEENHLTEAEPPSGSVSVEYNALGQRVEKQGGGETRQYIYDFDRLLQETDDSGQTQSQYTSTLEEYGDLVSEFDGAQTAYYQYDGLGSADALLDENETAADRYKYKAFGLEYDDSGSSLNPFTFVGQQHYYKDAELELYALGMGNSDGGGRQYDAATGTFLSKDPAEDDINAYRYVENNPVGATDPSGQQRAWSPERFSRHFRKSSKRAAIAVNSLDRGRITPSDFAREYMAADEDGDPIINQIDGLLNTSKYSHLKQALLPVFRRIAGGIPPGFHNNTGSRGGGTSSRGPRPKQAPAGGSADKGRSTGNGGESGAATSSARRDGVGASTFDPQAWQRLAENLGSVGNTIGNARDEIRQARADLKSAVEAEVDELHTQLQHLDRELDNVEKKVSQRDLWVRCFEGELGTKKTQQLSRERSAALRRGCVYPQLDKLIRLCNDYADGERDRQLKWWRDEYARRRKSAIEKTAEDIKKKATGLRGEAQLNRKWNAYLYLAIASGKDVPVTVAAGREVSEGTQWTFKILIGTYGEFATFAFSAPAAVGATASSKGTSAVATKASKSGPKAGAKTGGALGKLKDVGRKVREGLGRIGKWFRRGKKGPKKTAAPKPSGTKSPGSTCKSPPQKPTSEVPSQPGKGAVRSPKAPSTGLNSFSRASEFGIQSYGDLRKLTKGTGLQAHHLIEKRFANTLGVNPNSMQAIALTPAEHQVFTNAWRQAIPYGQGTANATRQQITNAARQIYRDYPDILRALGL